MDRAIRGRWGNENNFANFHAILHPLDALFRVETAMSNPILQSGQVTPQHLASFVTDGVIGDAGVTFNNTLGLFRSDVLGINFNATSTDFPISINLPVGYTKYRIDRILISGASGTLTTATCSVYTQAAAAGVNIVASATGITITTSLSDTVNNMQSLTVVAQNTTAFVDTTIYFRVQTAQGVIATGNVSVFYEPLP